MSLTQEFIDDLKNDFDSQFISTTFQHDELTVEIAKDDLLIEIDGANADREKFSIGRYFNQMKSKKRLVEIT